MADRIHLLGGNGKQPAADKPLTRDDVAEIAQAVAVKVVEFYMGQIPALVQQITKDVVTGALEGYNAARNALSTDDARET